MPVPDHRRHPDRKLAGALYYGAGHHPVDAVAFLRLGLVTRIVASFVIDAVLVGTPLLTADGPKSG